MERFTFLRDDNHGHIIIFEDNPININEFDKDLPESLSKKIQAVQGYKTHVEEETFSGNNIFGKHPYYVKDLRNIWEECIIIMQSRLKELLESQEFFLEEVISEEDLKEFLEENSE